MSKSSLENFVYKRRKLHADSDSRSMGKRTENLRRSGDCVSSVSCNTCEVTLKEKHVAQSTKHDFETVIEQSRDPTPKGSITFKELVDKTPKGTVLRIVEGDSANGSCSSSKSYVDQFQSSNNVELDETSDCSSSSVATIKYVEDLSEKKFCISVLRSHGLLSSDCSDRSLDVTAYTIDNCNTSFRSCKICSILENTSKLLICDSCEEAYHMNCNKPRIRKIPVDEWFCHSCVGKGSKMIKEKVARKFPSLNIECSGNKGLSSRSITKNIGLMSRKNEPYTTSVRIGRAFQAEVPDWTGPIEIDDSILEPTKLDPLEHFTFHEFNPCKTYESGTLNNWLQCQGVLDASENDLKNGTICGKWRRAPLFEVQTDDWECFCSVRWDPFFADCAVPQEIATNEVHKQLKRIEKMRPQLRVKWKNQRDQKQQ